LYLADRKQLELLCIWSQTIQNPDTASAADGVRGTQTSEQLSAPLCGSEFTSGPAENRHTTAGGGLRSHRGVENGLGESDSAVRSSSLFTASLGLGLRLLVDLDAEHFRMSEWPKVLLTETPSLSSVEEQCSLFE